MVCDLCDGDGDVRGGRLLICCHREVSVLVSVDSGESVGCVEVASVVLE